MWSSWVKEKGRTHIMYIAKLKMVQKELRKLSQWFWKGFFKCYDGGGKWNHIKKDFWSWGVFHLSKYYHPLYWKRLLEIFFLFLSFFFFFSLFFFVPSLEELVGFDDIWGGNHFFKNFFSNGFTILVVDAYSGMELCMPTWLNHDYGDRGVVDILMVDAYFGVELCTRILFWVRLANNVGSKSFLKKN
jgi:hypothetical protein